MGSNGAGKTNLLEAIAYSSLGKSIRFHKDEELVYSGQEYFALAAHYKGENSPTLKVQLAFMEGRKSLKLDNMLSKQLSQLIHLVKVIYSAPDDVQLLNGSPRLRRQYFDLAISQLFPDYLMALKDYLHVVDQRNALLKQSFSLEQKAGWDRNFIYKMLEVYRYRNKYLSLINTSFEKSYQNISERFPGLKIEYKAMVRDTELADETELQRLLSELQNREKQWQRSLIGPHLDDYSFRFAEHSLRAFGSGGQKRIAVIVLKLAQAALVEEVTHIKPIMLFDDIFAELDSLHSQKIAALLGRGFQSIIASPKPEIKEIFPQLKPIYPREKL